MLLCLLSTRDANCSQGETRRVAWATQMSFNAVDILTDEETRQLTDAGRGTYPMQRVDTSKNTHLRGDNVYVCVLARHKGRLVGNMETSRQRENFAQILLLVMWIFTVPYAVGIHELTSSFTHAVSRTDTPKEKKLIESCSIIFRFRVYPSTVQLVQGLKPRNLCCKNSWLATKNTKRRITLNEYNRLPTTRVQFDTRSYCE